MLEGAEEAEAAEASLEPRRNWGPVCGEQTDAIGAAAAVVRVRVSVLRRPSSVALNLRTNLHVLHVLSELPGASFGYGRPSHVQARERERGSSRSSQQANRSTTLVLEEQRKCNTSVRLGYHSHDQMVCV